MNEIENYIEIIGKEKINSIIEKSKILNSKRIACINSTKNGGGVAEMLKSLDFIFNQLGISFDWKIIEGEEDFFNITKKFHNCLQGKKGDLSDDGKKIYLKTNENFSLDNNLDDYDLVLIHDPQPLALINYYKKTQPWIWRCHIDLTSPNPNLLKFIKPTIEKYDNVVVSDEKYKQNIKTNQSVIYPAIDPLSDKNRNLSQKMIDNILQKYGINKAKPILSQVSRFDPWKDPEGVITVFDLVKKQIPDCQLVLLGNTASDDPEGKIIYKKIIDKYSERNDIKILSDVEDNDIVVNAIQSSSTVVIQKSLREGFGLVVAEAMYKKTPVVASNVGGITHQIINGVNGFTHDPQDHESFAKSIVSLINDKKLMTKIGSNAKKHIIENFLITRLVSDWLDLFKKHIK